jgi:hypothetical protein
VVDAAKALLEHGADLFAATNDTNKTPLELGPRSTRSLLIRAPLPGCRVSRRGARTVAMRQALADVQGNRVKHVLWLYQARRRRAPCADRAHAVPQGA